MRPARKITAEMTPAKIGRSMKNRDKDICDSSRCRHLRAGAIGSVACGAVARGLRDDRSARREPLEMVKDDSITRFEPGEHDAIAIDLGTERDAAILRLIAVTDDKDEALALVVPDRAFRHQQGIADYAIAHAHRDEHARNQAALGVVEARAGANAAGAAIDPVIKAVNVPAIDVILVACDHDLYLDFLLLFVRLAVIADVI